MLIFQNLLLSGDWYIIFLMALWCHSMCLHRVNNILLVLSLSCSRSPRHRMTQWHWPGHL